MALAVDIPSANRMDYYGCSSPNSLTTDSSSFTNLTPPPAFQHKLYSLCKDTAAPLTFENLSKVQLADPSSMPLARYCSELENYTDSITSSRKRRKDHVIESPRLLPFPYHNDSFFLPTAEHDYPGALIDTSSSFVSLHTFGSRQHLQQTTMVTPSSLRDVMVPQPLYTPKPQVSKKPWYKRLWKFLRPAKKQYTKTSEPVWYSQFRTNPPPPAGLKPL